MQQNIFRQMELNLSGLRQNPQAIGEVIHKLRAGDKQYTRYIRGEAIHIVDGDDQIAGITEAGLAHLFRLRHRTSNAFVFSPEGKLVLQRRVHNKRFPLYLTTFGGHTKATQTYKEAAEEEIYEELHLSKPPQGEFLEYRGSEIVYKDSYDIPSDNNLEIRALYFYRLTQDEWKQVDEMRKRLLVEASKRSLHEYSVWIEEQQRSRSGYGEVWSIEVAPLDALTNAKQGAAWIPEMDGVARICYYTIECVYGGNPAQDIAYFTPDLLDRFIKAPEVTEALKHVMSSQHGLGARGNSVLPPRGHS